MASSTSTPAPSRSLSSRDRQRRCLTCQQARAQQQLTITTSGAKPAIKPIRQTVNGQVVGAEVADLNSNGTPEIYVFVEGAGSGSYGELVAYAVMKGSNLSPISLPELTGAAAQGYQATIAKATGGQRQICYKLKAGEAGWVLRSSNVEQFLAASPMAFSWWLFRRRTAHPKAPSTRSIPPQDQPGLS
jgi:hypothetical protein